MRKYTQGEGNQTRSSGVKGNSTISVDILCVVGDMNEDGGWNIFDILSLINCILVTGSPHCSELPWPGSCAADVDGNGGYNISDIVILIQCILDHNCGGKLSGNSELDTLEAYQSPPGISQSLHDSILVQLVSGHYTIRQMIDIILSRIPELHPN